MPDAHKPLIRDGRVERPILEPPANAADEAAVVAATGGALPDDLRALHAVHDGTFAPWLPAGMSMAPYATTPTRWRSFPDLGDDDGAEPGIGIAIVQIPPRPFLAPVLEKYGQRADVERRFRERLAKLLGGDSADHDDGSEGADRFLPEADVAFVGTRHGHVLLGRDRNQHGCWVVADNTLARIVGQRGRCEARVDHEPQAPSHGQRLGMKERIFRPRGPIPEPERSRSHVWGARAPAPNYDKLRWGVCTVPLAAH